MSAIDLSSDEKLLVGISVQHPGPGGRGIITERLYSLEMNLRTGQATLAATRPQLVTADVLQRLDQLAELVKEARRAVLSGSL